MKITIYNFPQANTFRGDNWYNPYQQIAEFKIKANFHAHTKCWNGITFGNNSEKEISDAYRAKGYDLIGISNYHSISGNTFNSPLYIPLYEHGVNLFKVHNLVIGARKVILPGFPMHFFVHQTQQMLARTALAGELNVLAHPGASKLSLKELSKLSGYNLMEVGNTLGMSTPQWDAALSAGKPIWILCNDDTHDLLLEPTFVKWNIIYAKTRTSQAVIDALRTGQHFGVESYNMKCENYDLVECTILNDSLLVKMSHRVNRIDLIGQNGVQMATEAGTDQIAYKLKKTDTYIRAEVHMNDCVYYLNPVVRSSFQNGESPVSRYPQTNILLTWLVRFGVFATIVLTIWITSLLASKFANRSDS